MTAAELRHLADDLDALSEAAGAERSAADSPVMAAWFDGVDAGLHLAAQHLVALADAEDGTASAAAWPVWAGMPTRQVRLFYGHGDDGLGDGRGSE